MSVPDPPGCPGCSRALPGDAPGGLCPTCLLVLATGPRLALESQLASSQVCFRGYELLEELNRGGMGVVWRARHLGLGRDVALKMILAGNLASPSQIQRFEVEARAAARLEHPSIVPVLEMGEEDGRQYYTMRLFTGGNLAQLAARGPLASKEAARLVAVIARAVHFAHERGILHRDLKPSNVLLDDQGEPHVADFGLALLLEEGPALTRSDTVLGSPSYMAPEQASGSSRELTIAADVYGIGAILYELLTGQPPFDAGTPLETLRRVVDEAPEPPRALRAGVPRDLETVTLKCLEKQPGRRYASAAALAEDLELHLRGRPINARAASPGERLLSWMRRRPELATVLGALALAVLLGALGVVWSWRRAADTAADLRLHAYAADVYMALETIERGDLGRARALVAPYLSQSGGEALRGFEWRYIWRRAQGDPRTTIEAHEWIVTSLAYTPDSRLIASASMDKRVRVWDAATGTAVATLDHGGGAVWSVAFTNDGKRLLTSSSDGRIRLWSTETWSEEPWSTEEGELRGQVVSLAKDGSKMAAAEASPWHWGGEPGPITVWSFPERRRLPSPSVPGRLVAFAPDSRTLAFVGPRRSVRVWDAALGIESRTLVASGDPWTLSFSPDSRWLAAAGWAERAEVWDLKAPADAPARQLGGHAGVVWAAVFAPDGPSLATCASDQKVRIWETATWTLQRTLEGHQSEVWCAAFRPDGSGLATGGKDRSVVLWPYPLPPIPPPVRNDRYTRPAFSSDGAFLATRQRAAAGLDVVVVSTASRLEVARMTIRAIVGFAPATAELWTLDARAAAFERWSVGGSRSDVPLEVVRLARPENAIDPDRSSWAPAAGRFLAAMADGTVRVWTVETGVEVAAWPSGRGLRGAALSPDGRLAAISHEGELELNRYGVVLRDLESGRDRRILGHRDFVQGLVFSPDGRTLVTGGVDAALKLWDVRSGEELASLGGHLQDAISVSISPDGRTLASLGSHLDVRLWHLPTLREVAVLPVVHAGDLLELSPDGRWLAVNRHAGEILLLEAP